MENNEGKGFVFGSNDVIVTIEGKDYPIVIGDVAIMENLEKARDAVARADFEKMQSEGDKSKQALAMSNTLRSIVGALLGNEARKEIFDGRRANYLDELELVAYLITEVTGSKNEQVKRIDAIAAAMEELGISQA